MPAPTSKSSRTRWPGAFGATMITSWSAGGAMRPKWMLSPCAKSTRRARLEVRRDLRVPHALLHVVGEQHRDELRAANGLADRRDRQPGDLGRDPRRAALAQADDDVDARVVQVQRVRVPLAAVADDGDLAVQQLRVPFAVDRGHAVLLSVQCRTSWPRVTGARSRRGRARRARCERPPGFRAAARAPRTRRSPRASRRSRRRSRPAHVDDADGEDVAQRGQLRAALGRRRDLDERQLALERLAGRELGDAQHVDELVHLLLDLRERVLVAVDA